MTAGLSFVKKLEPDKIFCLFSQFFKEIFKRKIQRASEKKLRILSLFYFFWILSYDSIFKKRTRVGLWVKINTQPLHQSLNSELLSPVLNPKQHAYTSWCRFVTCVFDSPAAAHIASHFAANTSMLRRNHGTAAPLSLQSKLQ